MSTTIYGDEALTLDYDEQSDILTIEGIRYAGALFRRLGFAPIGTKFEIVAREDQCVTVRLLSNGSH